MNFNKKVMYLYIDKNCTICSNFGKKIVKQNQNIKIKDYTVKGKSIIFETDKNIYYEFEAINKALETIGIENKILKLILKTPKFLQKLLYKILSRSRKIISLFFQHNQTKI
tara:strand:- start:2429 stop:2761 length:333 start_codon:yes stop_codon:yes gene_type:complete